MKTSFSYLADLPLYETEKPYQIWFPEHQQLPKDIPQTNCEFETRSGIEVEDVRGAEVQPSLDSAGFRYLQDPLRSHFTTHDLSSGGNKAIDEYLVATAELVRKELKADNVICFDWRYRKSQPHIAEENKLEYDAERRKALQPAQHTHSDDSTEGALKRLSRHLNEAELARFESGSVHIQFINLWRPLVAYVEDAPLAFCDVRTVSSQDLIACDKIHPDHTNEGLFLKYCSKQRWYWLSRQTMDEPVMFLTWDSAINDSPVGPPHSAFHNSTAGREAPLRESLEVRLMVLKNR